MLTSATLLNRMPPKWGVEPLPLEAKFNLPGFFLACAIRSAMEWMGKF